MLYAQPTPCGLKGSRLNMCSGGDKELSNEDQSCRLNASLYYQSLMIINLVNYLQPIPL
jgi:hypothetical protein